MGLTIPHFDWWLRLSLNRDATFVNSRDSRIKNFRLLVKYNICSACLMSYVVLFCS